MPETKNPPGSERFRDEQRDEKTPRMNGGPWHDHEEPRDLDPVSSASPDAATEVESGGELEGMGRGKTARNGKRGVERADVASPRGKGKPGEQSDQANPMARGTAKPGEDSENDATEIAVDDDPSEVE